MTFKFDSPITTQYHLFREYCIADKRENVIEMLACAPQAWTQYFLTHGMKEIVNQKNLGLIEAIYKTCPKLTKGLLRETFEYAYKQKMSQWSEEIVDYFLTQHIPDISIFHDLAYHAVLNGSKAIFDKTYDRKERQVMTQSAMNYYFTVACQMGNLDMVKHILAHYSEFLEREEMIRLGGLGSAFDNLHEELIYFLVEKNIIPMQENIFCTYMQNSLYQNIFRHLFEVSHFKLSHGTLELGRVNNPELMDYYDRVQFYQQINQVITEKPEDREQKIKI